MRRFPLIVGALFLLFLPLVSAEVLWEYNYNVDWTKYQYLTTGRFIVKFNIIADFTSLNTTNFHFYQLDDNGDYIELNYYVWKQYPNNAIFYVKPINKTSHIRITYETNKSNNYGLEKIISVSSLYGLRCTNYNCTYLGSLAYGYIYTDTGKIMAMLTNTYASTYPSYLKYVQTEIDPLTLYGTVSVADGNIQEVNWIYQECNLYNILVNDWTFSINFDVKKDQNIIVGGLISVFARQNSSGQVCYYVIYRFNEIPKIGYAFLNRADRDAVVDQLLSKLNSLVDNFTISKIRFIYTITSQLNAYESNGILTLEINGSMYTYEIKRARVTNDINTEQYAIIKIDNGEPRIVQLLGQTLAWNLYVGETHTIGYPQIIYVDLIPIDEYPNNSLFGSYRKYTNKLGLFNVGEYALNEYKIVTGLQPPSYDTRAYFCLYKEGTLVKIIGVGTPTSCYPSVPASSFIDLDGSKILNLAHNNDYRYSKSTISIKLFDAIKTVEQVSETTNVLYTKPRYTSELFEISVAPSINLTKIYLYKDGALFKAWTINAFEEFNYSTYLDIGEYRLVVYSSGTKIIEDYWAVGYPPMATYIISSYPRDGDIIRQETNVVRVDINIVFQNTVPTQVALYEVYPDRSTKLYRDLGCFQSAGEHVLYYPIDLPTGKNWKISFISDYDGCTFYGTETARISFATLYGPPLVEQWATTGSAGFTDRGLTALEFIIDLVYKIFEIGALWWFIVAAYAAMLLADRKEDRYLVFVIMYMLGVGLGVVDLWLGLLIILGLLAIGLNLGLIPGELRLRKQQATIIAVSNEWKRDLREGISRWIRR